MNLLCLITVLINISFCNYLFLWAILPRIPLEINTLNIHKEKRLVNFNQFNAVWHILEDLLCTKYCPKDLRKCKYEHEVLPTHRSLKPSNLDRKSSHLNEVYYGVRWVAPKYKMVWEILWEVIIILGYHKGSRKIYI